MSEVSAVLWEHPDPTKTRTWAFKEYVEKKHDLSFETYESMRQWSITEIETFWADVWDFTNVKASEPFTRAIEDSQRMYPRPSFFPGAKLNFAQNLLFSQPMRNEVVAVITVTEATREEITWYELKQRVQDLSNALRHHGLQIGDRVAGYVGNHVQTLVAMLAATAVGASWTALSPDTGVQAVLDRLVQIEPTVLFADNASLYNGKTHSTKDKLGEIAKALPSLKHFVLFDAIKDATIDLSTIDAGAAQKSHFEDFVAPGKEIYGMNFEQLPPDHPVYILYSSGTTGKPKAIVHGAIGTLIQHKKEHDIQCGMKPGDRMLYFTTCTWMMWHWLVSALSTGVTLILYDGSPFRPLDAEGKGELAMPRLIDDLGVTHFGTSAKYLSVLEQANALPKEKGVSMSKLKAIYSTGSPLAPSTFEYVYRAFGPVNLGSITGGTDIISLFGAPSQISPVHKGEIQVRGLGMAVEAWDYAGKNVTSSGEPGDLVCVKPFPCQPVGFWGADGEERYKKSYFETFPGVWHHGDFIRINPATGGLIMLGRSDGVLKPAGVRFGSAEIYNVLLKNFAAEVEDALCIGRRRESDTDEKVVLFLKMAPEKKFSPELAKAIQDAVRKNLSARHVPAIIDECPEIPVTTNGKKVEVAVKQILSGTNIKVSASVANSECLDWYREWAAAHA